MENIENINNEETTENLGTKAVNAVKGWWGKYRGPIIGGFIGLTAGYGFSHVIDTRIAAWKSGKNEAEEAVAENDAPFDEDK